MCAASRSVENEHSATPGSGGARGRHRIGAPIFKPGGGAIGCMHQPVRVDRAHKYHLGHKAPESHEVPEHDAGQKPENAEGERVEPGGNPCARRYPQSLIAARALRRQPGVERPGEVAGISVYRHARHLAVRWSLREITQSSLGEESLGGSRGCRKCTAAPRSGASALVHSRNLVRTGLSAGFGWCAASAAARAAGAPGPRPNWDRPAMSARAARTSFRPGTGGSGPRWRRTCGTHRPW